MANPITSGVKKYFKIGITRGIYFTILLFIACYFAWLLSFPLFGPVLNQYFLDVKALVIERGRFIQFFMLSLIVSSIICGYLVDLLKRKLFFLWASIIMISIPTIYVLFAGRAVDMMIFSIILGVVAGISPPAWGAFFSDYASPEDRGRVLGLAIGLSMPIAFIFILNNALFILPFSIELIIVNIMYLIPIIVAFLKPKDIIVEAAQKKREKGPRGTQLLFYTLPVFLFYWVGGILFSIVFPTMLENVSSYIFYLTWSIPFLVGAIAAGSTFDSVGRKLPAIIGLAITGVSLAIFGVFGLGFSMFFLATLAIGFSISMVFSFLIWADLAPTHSRGKYYGLGMGLIATAMMLGLMTTGTTFGSISSSLIKNYMLYSSVALFICIPPLFFAEDLLPKELIEKRKMREYIEQAKQIRKG